MSNTDLNNTNLIRDTTNYYIPDNMKCPCSYGICDECIIIKGANNSMFDNSMSNNKVVNIEDAMYKEVTTEEELRAIEAEIEADLIPNGYGLSNSDITFNEDESITLSDNAIMVLGSELLDARNTINNILEMLGVGEVSSIEELENKD